MENELQEHPVGDSEQQVPSTVSTYSDESALQLVSPKPVITTVTKQAEISPTNKFLSTRKVSLGVNQAFYAVSPLSECDLQQSTCVGASNDNQQPGNLQAPVSQSISGATTDNQTSSEQETEAPFLPHSIGDTTSQSQLASSHATDEMVSQ